MLEVHTQLGALPTAWCASTKSLWVATTIPGGAQGHRWALGILIGWGEVSLWQLELGGP